jgi:hypothetical protein
MIGIHLNKVQVLLEKYKTEIEEQQLKALNKLNKIQTSLPLDRKYLDMVIAHFKQKDFLLKSPKDLLFLKSAALQVPLIKVYNAKKLKVENKKSEIKDKIILALNYKGLRRSFYPKYFQELGIKACVYCNSQLTITAQKYNGEYSARFDVDHYYSKDDYPFLCISLFNLYPSCATCNRLKSTNKVEFDLYTDEPGKTGKSSFHFNLDPYSKAKYLTSKDNSCIEFQFQEPINAGFQDAFHIKELYSTQKDIIEELIVKSQIYNVSYVKQLRSNFSKLALNPKVLERLLVGNYTEVKDIHKRPMSKFIQDIAKDLGLLK